MGHQDSAGKADAAPIVGAGPADAPLSHLGPQWFAIVMGWCGLGVAWHRAQPVLGPTADLLSALASLVALGIFLLLAVATVLRWRRHPAAVAADLRHPVRHAFVAAIPVSLILLGTLALAHGFGPGLVHAFWIPGVALQFVVTVWVLGRWLAGLSGWPALSPVLFIPVVGNVLVPLAGIPLGHPNLSWAFFAIGAFFWPIVVALLLARQSQQPLPPALQPSWFILVAPPAVIALDVAVLGLGSGPMFAMLGLAVFSLALALRIVPRLTRLAFGMPFWALSFPVAAFTALLLRAAQVETALLWPAVVMLVVVSIIVLGLSLATLRGLSNHSLLKAEPAPAAPAPAPASGGH